MADSNDTGSSSDLSLGPLGVAAGGLITLIAGLSVTGTVGRVVREEPTKFAIAITAVILGAALLTAAGLPATGFFTETIFSIIGVELALAGFVIAGAVAVQTGRKTPAPAVSGQLVDNGRRVTGKVVAANLQSNVMVVVQGLVMEHGTSVPTTLQRLNAGPDADGKVEVPVDVRLPAGRYDGVQIAAWATGKGASPDPPENTPCLKEDEASQLASKGVACVSLPMPPVPTSPTIEASWVGSKDEATRIEVHVVAANAPSSLSAAAGDDQRLAIAVNAHAPKKSWPVYRAALRPNGDGTFDAKFQVPVTTKATAVCVTASYVKKDTDFPKADCSGAVAELKQSDRTLVQLLRPAPSQPPPKVDP